MAPSVTIHPVLLALSGLHGARDASEVAVTRPGLHTGRRPLLHPLACP